MVNVRVVFPLPVSPSRTIVSFSEIAVRIASLPAPVSQQSECVSTSRWRWAAERVSASTQPRVLADPPCSAPAPHATAPPRPSRSRHSQQLQPGCRASPSRSEHARLVPRMSARASGGRWRAQAHHARASAASAATRCRLRALQRRCRGRQRALRRRRRRRASACCGSRKANGSGAESWRRGDRELRKTFRRANALPTQRKRSQVYTERCSTAWKHATRRRPPCARSPRPRPHRRRSAALRR